MIRKLLKFIFRILLLICVLALVGVVIYTAFFNPTTTVHNVERVIPIQ